MGGRGTTKEIKGPHCSQGSPFLKCGVCIRALPIKGGWCERLPRWFGALFSTSKWAIFCFRTLCTVHFLTHFGNVKDRLKKIGSEKSARGARLTVGGGLKLFGQCPYGHTTFQEGDSLTHGADAVLSVPK